MWQASLELFYLHERTNERTISMILNRTYMTYGFAWKFVAIETTDCALVLLPTHHNKPSDILCREVTKNTKYSHVEHVFWLKSPLKFRAIEEFRLRFGVDKRRWVQLIEDCLWKRRATQESNAWKKKSVKSLTNVSNTACNARKIALNSLAYRM